MAARHEQLEAGDVEAVIACVRLACAPSHTKVQEEVRTAADYFHRNAQRCAMQSFASMQSCKTICGQGLKRSGMHWTVKGANAIIALRCSQLDLTLGRILGGSCTRLVLFTHKFVVHPLSDQVLTYRS